jgi:hypothetical protein
MPLLVMALVGSRSPLRLGAAEDTEVQHIVVDMGELQMSFRCSLSLRYPLELSLVMGNLEVEV